MTHPEILLVPVFMLADHFLTLVAAVLHDKIYCRDVAAGRYGLFKTKQFELNPLMQEAVAQRKWFHPLHILLTIFVTAMLIMIVECYGGIGDWCADALVGGFLVSLAMLIGRELSNLLIFRRMLRNRSRDSGSTIDAHEMDLWVSLYHHLGNVLPLIVVATFATRAFAVGGCLGGAFLLAAHVDWIRQHKRKQRDRSAESEQRQE